MPAFQPLEARSSPISTAECTTQKIGNTDTSLHPLFRYLVRLGQASLVLFKAVLGNLPDSTIMLLNEAKAGGSRAPNRSFLAFLAPYRDDSGCFISCDPDSDIGRGQIETAFRDCS